MRLLVSITFLFLIVACREEASSSFVRKDTTIEGSTMGTTYHITYDGPENYKKNIDTLLIAFNKSLSTYDSTSTISLFNQAEGLYCFNINNDIYFIESLSRALEIAEETDGAFDPTIMPLVNYWGFGYSKKEKIETPDVTKIRELQQLVDYRKVGIMTMNDTACITKDLSKIQIDLSASAKGHGVDVVGRYLNSKGIKNFMVEIGGEITTKGVNKNGEPWVIGINKPSPDANVTEVEIPVKLSNKAMATSGNYRNFYQNGQITYAHIIDPKTGMARPTDILSTSILAQDCLTADAYATACMVLGFEKAKRLIEDTKEVDACFIYENKENKKISYYFSEGFKNHVDSTVYMQ